MSFLNHGFTGLLVFWGLSLILFGHPSIWLFILGFILGISPDTLDWLLAKLGLIERWTLYNWFHDTIYGFIVCFILLAPFPHVVLDKLVHLPVLPRKGTNPFMDELILLNTSRRRIIYLTGEAMVLFLNTTVLLLFLLI